MENLTPESPQELLHTLQRLRHLVVAEGTKIYKSWQPCGKVCRYSRLFLCTENSDTEILQLELQKRSPESW